MFVPVYTVKKCNVEPMNYYHDETGKKADEFETFVGITFHSFQAIEIVRLALKSTRAKWLETIRYFRSRV